jgi:hypothetical protein
MVIAALDSLVHIPNLSCFDLGCGHCVANRLSVELCTVGIFRSELVQVTLFSLLGQIGEDILSPVHRQVGHLCSVPIFT